MNVRLLSELDADVTEAVDWYNERRDRLGDEFEAMVYETIQSLPMRMTHPARDRTGYHPLRLSRFTAVLYYDTHPDEIVVAGLLVGGRSTSNLIGRG